MNPDAITLRKSFPSHPNVFGFAFADQLSPSGQEIDEIKDPLVSFIVSQVTTAGCRFAVADLRGVRYLSADHLGILLSLHRELCQMNCQLLLLVDDPHALNQLAVIHLPIPMATNESELDGLIREAVAADGSPSANEPPPEFTEEEIAEMNAGNLTLDDAIWSVEQMRRNQAMGSLFTIPTR